MSANGTELPIRDVRCHGEYWGQSGRALDISKMVLMTLANMDGSRFLQCTFAALPPHFARHPFLF